MSPVIISDVLCYVAASCLLQVSWISDDGGNELHSSQIEEHTMDFIYPVSQMIVT